jgi:hypothetical protein
MSKTERDLDLELDELGELDGGLLDDDVADPDEVAVDDASIDDSEPGGVSQGVDTADAPGDDEPWSELDDDGFVLPEIVMATQDDDGPASDGRAGALRSDESSVAREADAPDVSDDVLEELRRADIDGPTVQPAPQDDTSSGIRRPRRSADHDPSPFPIPMTVPRMLGRKPRVRRVTRVVRHVDPWSVFKIAVVANIVLYLIVLTAGVLLWNVAYATGTVDNVERFFESFGWSSFEFNGGEIYHNAWIGGLFVVIGLTGLAVLLATLFNLITDLVGGMRFTVLEEEVVEARTSPMRRFVVRRAEPQVPHVSYDESGPIVREAIEGDSGPLPR